MISLVWRYDAENAVYQWVPKGFDRGISLASIFVRGGKHHVEMHITKDIWIIEEPFDTLEEAARAVYACVKPGISDIATVLRDNGIVVESESDSTRTIKFRVVPSMNALCAVDTILHGNGYRQYTVSTMLTHIKGTRYVSGEIRFLDAPCDTDTDTKDGFVASPELPKSECRGE